MENYGRGKNHVLKNISVDGIEAEKSSDTLKRFFSSDNDDKEYNVDQTTSHDLLPVSAESQTAITPTTINDLEQRKDFIVDAIRSRPALWNMRDDNYNNQTVRSRLWAEVTNESNLESNANNILRVTKYWDSIKASYVRPNKRIAEDHAAEDSKYFKYFKLLSFLDTNYESGPRRSTEVSDDVESSEDLDESSQEDTGRTGRERDRSFQEESLELRRRYINVLERRTASATNTASSSTVVPAIIDPLDGFFGWLRPYLQQLNMMARLNVQQEMAKILIDALKKQDEDGNI